VDGIHGSCAEFIAVGAAVTAGERDFDCIVAIYGYEPPQPVLPPCGNCRQMLSEIAPGVWVILQVAGEYRKARIEDLLPHAHG
jgi:cytidine deaminase